MSETKKIPTVGERFTALSTYTDISGMGRDNSSMWLEFVVREDGSAVLTRGQGAVLPAAQVTQLFTLGGCWGLGPVTSLSQPTHC